MNWPVFELCGQVNCPGQLSYYKEQLCGLESAFGFTGVDTTVVDGFTTVNIIECDREPTSQWDPGFRLGAGTVWDCFDIDVEWTHFNGSAKYHEDEQHGHWKLRYDVIDLMFGRRFWIGSCVLLKPYIGVRGAQIHQSLKSHLEAFFTGVTTNDVVYADMDDKENFRGIGPEVGLRGYWLVGCDFSLYGKLNVVGYYGNVKGHGYNTDTFSNREVISNSRQKHCFNTIGTDAEIGIRWDKSICYCCYEFALMLNLGLEQHRIYDFSQLGSDGTLSLDGGVFGAGVGFRF